MFTMRLSYFKISGNLKPTSPLRFQIRFQITAYLNIMVILKFK